MALQSLLGLSLLAFASFTRAQHCPIQFEGRVPIGTTPSAFDSANTSLFNPSYNFGKSTFTPLFGSIPFNLSRSHMESNNQNPNQCNFVAGKLDLGQTHATTNRLAV